MIASANTVTMASKTAIGRAPARKFRATPVLTAEALRAIGVLALFGAVYASWKALAQTRVADLIGYAGIAFYSVLWWRVAAAGQLAPSMVIYTITTAFVLSALLLAWQRLRRRHGDITLERMHGLARPMPRFAAVFALLVMAAVGLPPFSLFFAQLGFLLERTALSPGLAVVLLTGFLSSWYLFRMMQRLFFGLHRTDWLYQDLRPAELAYFSAVIIVLALLSFVPPQALTPAFSLLENLPSALERMTWSR